jgi:hypothetical protein
MIRRLNSAALLASLFCCAIADTKEKSRWARQEFQRLLPAPQQAQNV